MIWWWNCCMLETLVYEGTQTIHRDLTVHEGEKILVKGNLVVMGFVEVEKGGEIEVAKDASMALRGGMNIKGTFKNAGRADVQVGKRVIELGRPFSPFLSSI